MFPILSNVFAIVINFEALKSKLVKNFRGFF